MRSGSTVVKNSTRLVVFRIPRIAIELVTLPPCPMTSKFLNAPNSSAVFFRNSKSGATFQERRARKLHVLLLEKHWKRLQTQFPQIFSLLHSRLDPPHARRPASSLVILNVPMMPVCSTCGPPQNSREYTLLAPSAIVYTETVSPYFSPNRPMAPTLSRLVGRHNFFGDGEVSCDEVVHNFFSLGDLRGRHFLWLREVKAQPLVRDVAAALLHVAAENLPKRSLKRCVAVWYFTTTSEWSARPPLNVPAVDVRDSSWCRVNSASNSARLMAIPCCCASSAVISHGMPNDWNRVNASLPVTSQTCKTL